MQILEDFRPRKCKFWKVLTDKNAKNGRTHREYTDFSNHGTHENHGRGNLKVAVFVANRFLPI